MKNVLLTGKPLSLEDAILIARGDPDEPGHPYPHVGLSSKEEKDIRIFREGLEDRGKAGDVIYGFNTGCGIRKYVRIPDDEIDDYQRHYIPAHCVGFGEPFPEEVVRLAMILRVNSFARGNSGVRLELCEAILDLYNNGVTPYIPQKGSVGASGDLCPLAHMSAVLLGLEGQQAWFEGKLLPAQEALQRAGLKPVQLKGKEAMALTNGCSFILADGLLATHDAKNLLRYSNLAAALSLEAIRGEKAAFDHRIHDARNHQGQIAVAAEIRRLTEGSQRMTRACQDLELKDEHKKRDEKGNVVIIPRVQDAYSFRCYPQVAGPALQLIEEAEQVFLDETGAATDNPLIFQREDGGFDALSGGNFHGEALAFAHERIKMAVQSLANISNSRFYALLDPKLSYGLPADLSGESDLNTGLMIAQYTVARLVSEGKVLGHAAVLDSIPTSTGQEDYVSMGSISARHCREMIDNSYAVVAWELIGAAQGISLTNEVLGNPELGHGTAAALSVIRSALPPMDDDRFLMGDHQRMLELMHSGALL